VPGTIAIGFAPASSCREPAGTAAVVWLLVVEPELDEPEDPPHAVRASANIAIAQLPAAANVTRPSTSEA
jgi:hypothetical protein